MESGPAPLALDDPANEGATEQSEDQAIALVKRSDVSAAELAVLARNPSVMRNRKVSLALSTHSRTPRHIVLPMLRRLFTFDLMQVALSPAVAAILLGMTLLFHEEDG
jgi:hypothetical protein